MCLFTLFGDWVQGGGGATKGLVHDLVVSERRPRVEKSRNPLG